jgi:glutaredoxin
VNEPGARRPNAGLVVALVATIALGAAFFGTRAPAKGIVIYTTTWCGYCRALRAHLDDAQIPYLDRDVEKSLSGFVGHLIAGGGGVPVAVIDRKVVRGYSETLYAELLAEAGYRAASP